MYYTANNDCVIVLYNILKMCFYNHNKIKDEIIHVYTCTVVVEFVCNYRNCYSIYVYVL